MIAGVFASVLTGFRQEEADRRKEALRIAQEKQIKVFFNGLVGVTPSLFLNERLFVYSIICSILVRLFSTAIERNIICSTFF